MLKGGFRAWQNLYMDSGEDLIVSYESVLASKAGGGAKEGEDEGKA